MNTEQEIYQAVAIYKCRAVGGLILAPPRASPPGLAP